MIDEKLLEMRHHRLALNGLLSAIGNQVKWMERRFKEEERNRILEILEQYDFGFMYDSDSDLMKEIEAD